MRVEIPSQRANNHFNCQNFQVEQSVSAAPSGQRFTKNFYSRSSFAATLSSPRRSMYTGVDKISEAGVGDAACQSVHEFNFAAAWIHRSESGKSPAHPALDVDARARLTLFVRIARGSRETRKCRVISLSGSYVSPVCSSTRAFSVDTTRIRRPTSRRLNPPSAQLVHFPFFLRFSSYVCSFSSTQLHGRRWFHEIGQPLRPLFVATRKDHQMYNYIFVIYVRWTKRALTRQLRALPEKVSMSHRTKFLCVEFSFVEARLLGNFDESKRLKDFSSSFDAPPCFRLCERIVLAEIWFCRNHSSIDKCTYAQKWEHLTNLKA